MLSATPGRKPFQAALVYGQWPRPFCVKDRIVVNEAARRYRERR